MMITIYLNEDPFCVPRDEYFEVVEESDGNWIMVTEWIEKVGIFLGTQPRDTNSLLPFDRRGSHNRDGSATEQSISHLPDRC